MSNNSASDLDVLTVYFAGKEQSNNDEIQHVIIVFIMINFCWIFIVIYQHRFSIE